MGFGPKWPKYYVKLNLIQIVTKLSTFQVDFAANKLPFGVKSIGKKCIYTNPKFGFIQQREI